MKIHHLKQCPLSKSNFFYQNFMKLGHIVKYHDVFFKFDNGPYRTMLSVAMALYENSPFKTTSALSVPYCTMLSRVMALCSFKLFI